MNFDESAFPVAPTYYENGQVQFGTNGMTLLDYFAAKELSKTEAVSVCDIPEAYERLADHCYRMAVAMVKEREKYLK